MNTQVSFPLAVLLKEKGFSWKTGDIDDYDEGRHGYFKHNKGRIAPLSYFHFDTNHNGVQWTNLNIPAPTIGEVVIWLYEKHGIWISVETCIIGSDEWDYGYKIVYLPKEFENAKRRAAHLVIKESFQEQIGSYSGAWHSPTEAYEAAIEYTLKNLI
jgi:hypothetical protein